MIFSVEKKASVIKRKLKALREEMIQKEKFRINDLVSYNEFLELYSKYGATLTEEEFAYSFLDLLKTDLYSLKKNRCRILKKEEVDDFETAFLKLQLIKSFALTKGLEISYIQLQQLYDALPSKLPLVMFAENVLDVSSHSVSCIKCNATKNATIFNKTSDTYFENKDPQELKKDIETEIIANRNLIQELKDSIALDRNLHIGDSITTAEFTEMYEIYGKKDYSAYDFARIILGLSEGKARGIINQKIDSAQVWNNEIVSLDYLLKLREEIINKEQLHINDRLETYDDFLRLFKQYSGILSETIFAEEILDMTRASYKRLKAGKIEAIILSDIVVPEDFWETTKSKIKKNENVYNGKRITYSEFLELYQKYGVVVWDVDFAQKVLQVSPEQFYCLKRGEYNTNKIFGKKDENSNKLNFDEDYSLEEIEKLREIVIDENNLHIADSMSGRKFEQLYEKYGFGMSKKFFAEKILDIKSYRLNCILRDETDNATILLNEKVGNEYLKSLRSVLFKSGEHCTEDMIDYKEFLRLYKIYGGKLSERQFAEKILFITNDNLGQIRENQEKGRETEIFANLKLSDAYIAALKAKIIRKNLLYYRQNITPEFFRMMYKQTRTVLSEADFAKIILEVNRQSYYKTCINKENETFIILSISGTDENKPKFLERQQVTLKKMFEEGFCYSEIAEKTNLTTSALMENIESLYESGVDRERVKKKYVRKRLDNGENIESERAEEYGIDDKYIENVKKEIEEEKKFKALEIKCQGIVDDLKETKLSKKYIREYIEKCKERYEEDASQMDDDTLEYLHSCLEFLDENNMENTKFFIKACIDKKDFYRANDFITFAMQTPKLKVGTKSALQDLRVNVRHAIRMNDAMNMILNGKSVREVVESTGLLQIEVMNLMKKFQVSKVKS